MDVRAGPVPLDDLPFVIANWNGTSPEPAVISITPAQAIFGFIVVPRLSAAHPVGHAPFSVLGMYEAQPTETVRGTCSCTGIFIKSIADVVSSTVCSPAKDDVRSSVHNGIQFLMLACEFVVKLLQHFRSFFQFIGALRHSPFELTIQSFQLVRLAVQLSKYADFRPQ